MLKTALAAALIVGAGSSGAFATATQYYLDTAGGGQYCDGLLLTVKGKNVTGTHNSPEDECTEGDYAGGFLTKGFSSGAMGPYETVTPKTQLATVTTEDEPNGGTNFEIIFNLDLKALIWSVYVVEDGSSPVNGGPLGTDEDTRPRVSLHRPSYIK